MKSKTINTKDIISEAQVIHEVDTILRWTKLDKWDYGIDAYKIHPAITKEQIDAWNQSSKDEPLRVNVLVVPRVTLNEITITFNIGTNEESEEEIP